MGHWKPSNWNCHFCRSDTPEDETAKDNTEEHSTDSTNTKLSTKHRKSNVDKETPEKEFLTSQINTLKSIVAKREAELKKVQESDNLKAKRIRNLEAQLDEARKQGYNEITPEHPEVISNPLSLLKIKNLEDKTEKLEHQVELLFSKLENPTHTVGNPSICYICEVCDVEFHNKGDLRMHQDEVHRTLYHCEYCKFTAEDSKTMNDQKQTHRLHHCTNCSFRTISKNDIEKHKHDVHMKCHLCSYHGIHQRYLNRHKSTMHSKAQQCQKCKYIASSESDLKIHKQNEHMEESPNDCNPCDSEYRTNRQSNNHHTIDHQFKQKTRIFSSSRRASTSTPSNPSIPKQKDVFRPWSQSSPTMSRVLSANPPFSEASNVRISKPRPFTTSSSQCRFQE